MTLFVDASALVAIIAGEAERAGLVTEIGQHPRRLWSAMSCWEAVSAMRSSYRWSMDEARREVERTADTLDLVLVPLDEAERSAALDAYQRFGKGSRHPARLNMGDCFAYACAKTNGARLLYKGDDFAHTDLA